VADFEQFDLVLAMDWENMELLQEICPPRHRAKLRRLAEFAHRSQAEVVPDPYYSGPDGFEQVLDLVEDACEGLIRHLVAAPQQNPGTS
jgi:protein-tyrosine phosphatase